MNDALQRSKATPVAVGRRARGLLALLATVVMLAGQGIAATAAQASVMATPRTQPQTATFLDPTAYTFSPSLVRDASGGLHTLFVRGGAAVYAECAPAAGCGDRTQWRSVTVNTNASTGIPPQLLLTPGGAPRILLANPYRYLSCDTACTTAGNWSTGDLSSKFAGYDKLQGPHFLALDPQGRPRFLYTVLNADDPADYGLVYASCDAACTTVSNWTTTVIHRTVTTTQIGATYEQPTLAFDAQGVARVVTNLFEYQFLDNPIVHLVYLECSAACTNEASWAFLPLADQTVASAVLRVDPAGATHLASVRGGQLSYQTCLTACAASGSHWVGGPIGLADSDGLDPDLGFDAQSHPTLVFNTDNTTSAGLGLGLGVATCTSACNTATAAWQVHGADDGTTAPYTALGFDQGCGGTSSAWFVGALPSLVVSSTGGIWVAHQAKHIHTDCLQNTLLDITAVVVDQLAGPTSSTATGGAFRPLPPTRILDTRSGPGPVGARGPGSTLDLQITGSAGIPATGVSAVVFNVTAVSPSAPGYLTVYPTGATRPTSANLNYGTGDVVPNLVEVAVGAGGKVSLYNGSTGSTHYVVDLAGWVTTADTVAGASGRYNPLTPARVLDTRAAFQVNSSGTPLHPSPDLSLVVTGKGGVPATGVSAVVLNVAVTNPNGAGWLSAYPGGGAAPLAANLNFSAGQTVSNRVVVAVGTGGAVNFHLGGSATAADVVADVGGWFTDAASASGGSLFSGLTPNRIADTRPSSQVGPRGTILGAGQTMTVTVAGSPGVPAMGTSGAPKAAVLNVAVTNTTGASYLTVFPSGEVQPLASDLNWAPGATRSNLVVAKVGADGSVKIYNNTGNADIVVDVLGWYA